MKSHLKKPHHSYNNLDLGHTPTICEVTSECVKWECAPQSGQYVKLSKVGDFSDNLKVDKSGNNKKSLKSKENI